MRKLYGAKVYKAFWILIAVASVTYLTGVFGWAVKTNYSFSERADGENFYNSEMLTGLITDEMDAALAVSDAYCYFTTQNIDAADSTATVDLVSYMKHTGEYSALASSLSDEDIGFNVAILNDWGKNVANKDASVDSPIYVYYNSEAEHYFFSEKYYGEDFFYDAEKNALGNLTPVVVESESSKPQKEDEDDDEKEEKNPSAKHYARTYHVGTLELVGERSHPTVDGRRLTEIANNVERNGGYYVLFDAIELMAKEFSEEYARYIEAADLTSVRSNLNWAIYYPPVGVVFTNTPEYSDFALAEAITNDVVADSYGYVRYTTGLSESKLDIKDRLDENLREKVAKTAGVAVLLRLDSNLPINDIYRSSFESYNFAAGLRLELLISISIAIGAFVIAFILLTLSAGHVNRYDGIYLNAFDEIPTLIGIVIIALAQAVVSYIYYMFISLTEFGNPVTFIMSAFYGALSGIIILTGYLSIVRRIKAKTFWTNSLCAQIGRAGAKAGKTISKVVNAKIRGFVFVLVYVVLIIAAQLLGPSREFTLAAVIGLSILLVGYVVYYLSSVEEVKKALRRMEGGNLESGLAGKRLAGDAAELADLVGGMQDALKSAVEKSVADERMKVDLITNVSHDLKTPLTSIVTYTELLKKEIPQESKASDYLRVIEEKTARLRMLTEGVVEASKISSGNIEVEPVTLDLGEMIRQVGGENSDKFEARDLTLVERLPEETVTVVSDGRHLYRILENLYHNAAKYALTGTRIYAELTAEESEIVFTLKNVSVEPLEVTPSELTERFVRGDKARKTEGSGLGLSIAKSLADALGAGFDVEIDGDLFKAILTFPRD